MPSTTHRLAILSALGFLALPFSACTLDDVGGTTTASVSSAASSGSGAGPTTTSSASASSSGGAASSSTGQGAGGSAASSGGGGAGGQADPCGNSALDSGEGCDDGGQATGDGCDASCQVEPGWDCTTTCTPILYAAEGRDVPGSLRIVDKTDASTSVVGALTDGSNNYGMTSMAFGADGTLYGATGQSQGRQLVTVDLATGMVTLLGVTHHAGDDTTVESLPGLTWVAGTLLGLVAKDAISPATVNTTNGEVTPIGSAFPGGGIVGGGLAAAADGTVHGFIEFYDGNTAVNLYQVNPMTGVATMGPVVPLANETLSALTFCDGVLYGIDAVTSDTAGALVTIDPANGNLTSIGALPSNIDALACVKP